MNLNDLRNNAYTNAKNAGEEIKAGEGFKKFGAAAAAEVLKGQGLLKVPVQEPAEEGKESVYRRVAKFFLLIGEDEAAKILPHLSDDQIEKISESSGRSQKQRRSRNCPRNAYKGIRQRTGRADAPEINGGACPQAFYISCR